MDGRGTSFKQLFWCSGSFYCCWKLSYRDFFFFFIPFATEYKTSASINIKYSRDTTPRSRRRCRAGLVSFGAVRSWGLWPTDQGCWCCATVRVGRRTTAFAAGVGAEGLAGIGEQTGMALERTARTIKNVKISCSSVVSS